MNNLIYNILKENNVIGKGAFGKIYYNPKSSKNYVVKKINKYNKFENNFILNNIKELWWYSVISSEPNYEYFENIPHMMSYYIDSDYIYLLIEHRGLSIYNIVKDILSTNDIEKQKQKHIELLKLIPFIIYSCSKTFRQLHYASMRHGDITISNILIKDTQNIDNKISIVDWGSIVFNKVNLNHYNQCAADFVSPELRFENTNKISIKSDIFSLGLIILYIIDIHGKCVKKLNDYITKSEVHDYQYETLNDILNSLKSDYIPEFVNEKTFFLLSKMLEIDTESRIDVDSLYQHELFCDFRKNEKEDNRFFLRNILKKSQTFSTDPFKRLLVEHTYTFLKKYKSKELKPLLDTRVILSPSIKLFYTYLETHKPKHSILNITANNSNVFNNLNQYIVSFLCCLKWNDIIINDDISIYYLYEYYTNLYKLLSSQFSENFILDLTNFLTLFDLTFYLIFKTLNGYVFNYPDFMDFNYNYIDHGYIKKLIINSDNF